jgi:hypothetical protein
MRRRRRDCKWRDAGHERCSRVLPGVKSTAAGLVPPGAVGAGTALRAASIGTSDVPFGFSLPTIGPVLPERPSFGLPVAAAGESDDLRNVGLAYWGGRVTGMTARFDALLGTLKAGVEARLATGYFQDFLYIGFLSIDPHRQDW